MEEDGWVGGCSETRGEAGRGDYITQLRNQIHYGA